MSDNGQDAPTDGLTEQEAETAVRDLTKNWPDAEVTCGRTENGGFYVVAKREGLDGALETRTVRREQGRYAILGTNGRPILEADIFPLSKY